jgi:hypothetical protein
VLGQIVTLLMPAIMAAAQSGNLTVGGIISQAIAGGAGGAILTAIIGAIKNKAAALVRLQVAQMLAARYAQYRSATAFLVRWLLEWPREELLQPHGMIVSASSL